MCWLLQAMVKVSTKTITITQAINLVHTCESADHYFRHMHSNSSCLVGSIMEIVIKNKATIAFNLRDSPRPHSFQHIVPHCPSGKEAVCM